MAGKKPAKKPASAAKPEADEQTPDEQTPDEQAGEQAGGKGRAPGHPAVGKLFGSEDEAKQAGEGIDTSKYGLYAVQQQNADGERFVWRARVPGPVAAIADVAKVDGYSARLVDRQPRAPVSENVAAKFAAGLTDEELEAFIAKAKAQREAKAAD